MIKKINLLYAIFVILGIRAGIMGASIGDAMFLVSIVGYAAYLKWLEAKEMPDYKALFQEELNKINNKVSGLVVKETKPDPHQQLKRFF